MGGLISRVAQTEDEGAKSLLQHIKQVAVSGKGYLPQQLREDLAVELGFQDDDVHQFVECIQAPLRPAAVERKKRNMRLAGGLNGMTEEKQDSVAKNTLHLEALDNEMGDLKAIVNDTNIFKSIPNAEPEWNQKIHGPMLEAPRT